MKKSESFIDELALKTKSTEMLKEMVNRMIEGILAIGHDGTILFANPAASEMLGISRSRLIGKKVGALFLDNPINEDFVQCILDAVEIKKVSAKTLVGSAPELIKHYVELLTKNIDTEDWALRYFAAQTYLDLYNRTKDKSNIDKAYSLTLDNVNYLIDEQKSQNNVYLADIKKKAEPKGATKEVKKEIKDYNKMLEQERKTKLAPIYEPLRLNCDLLFALANELNISENEQKKIERILHGSSRKDSLFLNETLDNKYYFDKQEAAKDNITLEKGVLTVPVSMVSDETTITVVIGDGTSATTADDWKLKKVERKKSGDITTFEAQYTSKKADDATYNDGTKVSLEINAIEDEECKPISATFKTVKTKKLMITDYRFVRTDQ